jgi:hypothetical protein
MWNKNNYYGTDVLETLYKNHNDNIVRVDYKDLSVEEFTKRFDEP